jgi:hypothetical protein
LKDVSARYPGATIAQTMNASGTVMVTMKFYKKEMAANGWTITAENHSQGHSGLMGVKGSNSVIINIGKGQSGKSIIGVMLAPKQ